MYLALQTLDMPIQLGSEGTTGESDECDWLDGSDVIFQGPLIKFPTWANVIPISPSVALIDALIWQVKDNSVPRNDIPGILEWDPLQDINPSTDAIQITFINSGHLLSRANLVLKTSGRRVCRRTINPCEIFISPGAADKFGCNLLWILTRVIIISGIQGNARQSVRRFNTSEEKSNQIQQPRSQKEERSQRSMVMTASLIWAQVCSSSSSTKLLWNATQYHRLMSCEVRESRTRVCKKCHHIYFREPKNVCSLDQDTGRQS